MSISFFAGTNSTRALFSQEIEGEVAFNSVIPTQSKLIANDGHVFQAELHWFILAIIAKGNKREPGASEPGARKPSTPPGQVLPCPPRIPLRPLWDASQIRGLLPLNPPPTGDCPPAAH